MKSKQKIIRTILGLILLIIIVIISVGYYLLDFALSPENRGKDIKTSFTAMRNNYPQIKTWMDSLLQNHLLKDTFITVDSDIRLHAYYVHASKPTPKTAMIIHGYTDNAIRMMHIGYLYSHDLGYNIILPDLRYSGQSDGRAIQMGWLDRLDVERWIRLSPLILNSDSLSMVVHGISMGAATTMMVSGDIQPRYVQCFVEDCGYTSVWDQFSKQLKEQFNMPTFPLLYVASYLCHQKYGWYFSEASAINQIRQCQYPMLFIHGSNDTYVPTSMVYSLYNNKPGAKQLWIAPGSSHAMSYHDHPQEYTRRVKEFLDKYMH